MNPCVGVPVHQLPVGSSPAMALPRRLVSRHAARFGLTAVELPFKRKADPIQAVTTKAAMLDAGVAWLVGTLISLFAVRK